MLNDMRRSEHPNTEIRSATKPDQKLALDLLFRSQPVESSLPQISAILEQAESASNSLDGLAIARRNGQTLGAVWLQVLTRETALLWPPSAPATHSNELARELLVWACEQAITRKVRLVQVLVNSSEGEDATLLEQFGFHYTTDVLSLMCHYDRLPQSKPISGLDFELCRSTDRKRLEAVVAATFQGTLDCPTTQGLRSVADAIEGYEKIGELGQNNWLFVRQNGLDIGCLLLADHSHENQWEFVYMGLVESARGHHLGHFVVDYGCWLARCKGRLHVFLAVDASNTPAMKTYIGAGFEETVRRCLFLKTY